MITLPDRTFTSVGLKQRLRDPHDAQAWRTFWSRYIPRIRSWAHQRGLDDDEAEEVTSKVLEKLVVAMPTFRYDSRQRFRAWLRTVVNHVVFDHWRARRRRPGDQAAGGSLALLVLRSVEDEPNTAGLVEELNEELEQKERIQYHAVERARARVEERTWAAFWQTAVEQRKAADVAGELGMTVAAVHVARNRVSKILREEFAAQGLSQE
jgi:RNA polymerase sigma-70 factor (ECF subfamily)